VKTQRAADLRIGIFLALLGVGVIYASSQITGGLEERLPPRTLPYCMGFTILVSGGLLALRTWRLREEGPTIQWPNRVGVVRILVCLVSLALYIALMNPLGLPWSTFLYVSFSTWYLGRYRIWKAVLMGVLSGAASYLLFIYLLELSFPVGPLLTR
jgi:putative tricarboxylic transport membrane protein